ncbi:hypothetical protein CR513_20191, partial [Mucuna pruriens]
MKMPVPDFNEFCQRNVKIQAYSLFNAPLVTVHSPILDQHNATISIQVAQPWGSRADRDGDPTCQQKCCATPRHSRRRSCPGQRVDLPSRFLCVGHGGRTIQGRIHFGFGTTLLDDDKDED